MMQIVEIRENKKRYLELLLLGDEQESMIDRYLGHGALYVGFEDGEAVAVCAVTEESGGALEIKNLAVAQGKQRRGLGREMLEYIEHAHSGRFRLLRLGTGESPATLPFYEKCGFSVVGRISNFFTDHYDHPIIEGGVLLRDMVILERSIKV